MARTNYSYAKRQREKAKKKKKEDKRLRKLARQNDPESVDPITEDDGDNKSDE